MACKSTWSVFVSGIKFMEGGDIWGLWLQSTGLKNFSLKAKGFEKLSLQTTFLFYMVYMYMSADKSLATFYSKLFNYSLRNEYSPPPPQSLGQVLPIIAGFTK